MSRAVRCIECFRTGPKPPHSWMIREYGLAPTLTERQRKNNLATFWEREPNLPLHVALTGHNEWDHLATATAQWERLGAYLGDGYFEADEEEK